MLVRTVRKENGYREFSFGHGLTDYKRENYEIEQDIESALLEFKNDCFFALQNGIDWLTRLGYPNQKQLLDEDIVETILSRYGVLDVRDFESEVLNRNYMCKMNVFTIYSDEAILIEFTQGL